MYHSHFEVILKHELNAKGRGV